MSELELYVFNDFLAYAPLAHSIQFGIKFIGRMANKSVEYWEKHRAVCLAVKVAEARMFQDSGKRPTDEERAASRHAAAQYVFEEIHNHFKK